MEKTPVFVFFLSIVSAILFVGNLFVYEALALLFGIRDSGQLLALAVFLGISSASFIAASVLGRYSHGRLEQAYYKISAVWMGIFGHLFLFSSAFGLAVVLQSLVPGFPALAAGSVFFAAAICASIYGIFHARNVIVKEIIVPLANLPEAWRGKKLAILSDLHLGPIYSDAFVAKIARILTGISPDMVAIVGDLFDGVEMPHMDELLEPLRALEIPFGKYFVTGNHEEFSDPKRFLRAVESAGIRILRNEAVTVEGIDMIGVNHHSAADREEFRQILALLPLDRVRPSILFKHEPKDIDVAEEAGISFQISGHTHAGQFWPFGYIASLTYRGFSYGLKFRKKLAVYVSSGAGTWGPPFRVGTDSEIVVIRFSSLSPPER